MPARDIYHDAVRTALKDGWTITHDPLRLSWGDRDMYVDLGAEHLLEAERTGRRIAVEVKSFVGNSELDDLEKALGQYVLYRAVLTERDPERTLFLAVPIDIFWSVFNSPLGELLMKSNPVRVIGFDPDAEVIVEWLR